MWFWYLQTSTAIGRQAHRRDRGFSILEVLLAALIVTSALGILASQLTTQVKSPRKAAAQAAIEAAATSDLNWIRRYAQLWLAESGPFDTTSAITKASTFTKSSDLSYEADKPDPAALEKNLCESTSFTSAFLADANSTSVKQNLQPTNSNEIKAGLVEIKVGTSTLTRTITAGQLDHITITYSMKEGSDPFELGFKRTAAVLLDASAWCSS